MAGHLSVPATDEDGWIVATCTCGATFGPCPDAETATDILMDHAYEAGLTDGKQHADSVASRTAVRSSGTGPRTEVGE